MKAHVDHEKCQGHARCYLVAPETFLQDEQGYAYTTDDDVPAELQEAVRQAERNCPESAITITE